MESYYEILEQNHFGDLFSSVISTLKKGDNVCVSAIYGCGQKTFLNLFSLFVKKEQLFEEVYLYDPKIEDVSLVKFSRQIIRKNTSKKLIVVRLFELIADKSEVLEQLQSIRQPDPSKTVFLFFTDHSGVTSQKEYLAKSSPFFGSRFYIHPFDLKQTVNMIKTLEIFFNWKISTSLYEKISRLSGGIPRLIKYICKEIAENNADLDDPEQFIENPSIQFQLELLSKISLSTNKRQLIILGLLNSKSGFKSQLLEYYFKQMRANISYEVLPNLSKTEKSIFSLLFENKGRLVDLERIGDYFELAGHSYSLWAIYKLISRLKTKLKNIFTIESHKGQGYLLREG